MAFTITANLPWSTAARTRTLNNQDRGHIGKGIFSGGEISPVPGNLQVSITDFSAKSFDGMTVVVTGGPDIINIADGQVNHICLEARHNENAPPTLNMLVLTAAAYAAHGQLPYLILLGTVDLTAGGPHVEATTNDISYETRDELDVRARSSYRGVVADAAALATLATSPHHLRAGDIWGYLSPAVSYFQWDGSSFTPIGTPTLNVLSHQYEMMAESQRRLLHSGVVRSGFPGHVELGDDLPLWPVNGAGERVAASSTVMIGGLAAIVNGHFLLTYNTKVAVGVELSATPGAVSWDGIMLEVWREEYANPSLHTFSKGGGASQSLGDAILEMASMDRDPTDFPGVATGMYEKTNLGSDEGGTMTRFRYRFAVYQNLTGGPAAPDLSTPCTSFTGKLNTDGNAWERIADFGPAAGEAKADVESVYRAVHAGSPDGYSWGIPIAVIRRVPGEVAASEIYDTARPDDLRRQIFPVAPVVKTEQAHRHRAGVATNADLITNYTKAAQLGYSKWQDSVLVPSGILTGCRSKMDTDGALANELRIPEMEISILGQRIRVAEEYVSLGVAPISGHRRDLIVLEMRIVRHVSGRMISTGGFGDVVIPELTDQDGNLYRMGLRYVVTNVAGAVDVESAMVAAGYATMSALFTNGEVIEPGLWQKAFGSDSDFEHPFAGSRRYALPIAIVHRRNSLNFTANLNPNGSHNGGAGARPDEREHDWIYQEDIGDLRQQVILDRGRLDQLLEESYEALLQGRLRTDMKVHPVRGSSIAGVQHLHQDAISWNTGGADPLDFPSGYNNLCDDGGGISGARAIWSYADQTQPMYIYIGTSLIGGSPFQLGGYNRTGAARHVTVGVSALGVSQVDVVAPSGAVFAIESGTQPYVRMWEFTGPNTAKVAHAAANFSVPGGLENITAFSFDMPDAFKGSLNPKIIEFMLVFKGIGPGGSGLVEVSRGLAAPPDVLLQARAATTADDGVTKTVVEFDVAPPMRFYSVAVSGAGNDEFEIDLTLGDPGGEGPLCVGIDLFRGGTGDYLTGHVGKYQAQRERPTFSVFSAKNQPHRTEPDGSGNTLFGVAPGARVTANVTLSKMLVRTDVAVPGSVAKVYIPHRNSTDKMRWIECEKGGQTYMGNFVWGSWQVSTAGDNYFITAGEFSDAAGNPLSPQSMFWHGCCPMVDLFIWRRAGGGGNEEWELIPDRTKEGGSVWNVDSTNNVGAAGFIELNFVGAQDGYDISGGGHDILVIARILEPPVYDNYWDNIQAAHAFTKTVHQDVSYMATPYQGTVNTTPHLATSFFGEVMAVGDTVTVTTAGRVAQLRDLSNFGGAVDHPVSLQADSAYVFANPAEVFLASLGDFNFEDYPSGYGALAAQLPILEEFNPVSTNGHLPLNSSSGYYRLLKHLWGPLLDGSAGQGTFFAVPVGGAAPKFDADMQALKPGAILEDIPAGVVNLGEIYNISAGNFPPCGPRGAFIAHWDQGLGQDTRRVKGGAVNFGPRSTLEYREIIAARGLDVSLALARAKAFTVNANFKATAGSSNWRHVIVGGEGQELDLHDHIPMLTAYAYVLRATGPLQDRSNTMMIVTTRISVQEDNPNIQGADNATNFRENRLPGEAFDAFYMIGRPIIKLRGE